MHLLLAALLALTQAQRSAIDAVVANVMTRERIPGLSLGVARRGTRLYMRGYGLRDAGRNLAADAYTVYRIGSITKQFTAALTLQDAGAGRVTLDAPARQYLPLLAADATVAQLLAQTSGIASYTDFPRPPGTSGRVRPALLQALAEPAAFAPGTQWQYSNTNYLLLGMLLESVDGQTFAGLVRARLALPLDLRSTNYGFSPFAQNVARGYAAGSQGLPVPVRAGEADYAAAAGALTSNVPDLLAWLEDLRAGRVVSHDAFAAMTSSRILPGGVPAHYGYGFFATNWFGYRVAAHGGNVDGYSGMDALVLDDGLEVAVLTNRGGLDLQPLVRSVVAAIDAALDPNLSASFSQPARNENALVSAELQAILAAPEFAALGSLVSIEFLERSQARGVITDRYRLTFSRGQWLAQAAYRPDGTIVSLTLRPAA